MRIINSFDNQISKAISEGWFPDRNISVRQLIAEGIPLEKHDTELLDKIKAEIMSMDFDFGDYCDHTETIIDMVCKAIDKHKPERGVGGY